jgi:hypothetical protein
MYLDGGNNIKFQKDANWIDNEKALFGTGSDLQIWHGGIDSYFVNWSGNLYLINKVSNKHIIFSTNNTERARITSGGNLLIGTTTDSGEKLVVDGTAKVEQYFYINDTGNTNNFSIRNESTYATIVNGTRTLNVVGGDKIFLNGSFAEAMRIKAGGNVLIGTTTDSGYKLQVNGDIQIGDGDILRLGDSSDLRVYHNGTDSVIDNVSGGDLYISQKVPDKDLIFRADDGTGGFTDYIRLDGSQTTVNVYKTLLIGTTTNTGAYKIDVAGKQRVQDTLELDDVLMLNAISTPSDPAAGKSVIYMDSSDGGIKCKINVGGTVVTRTIASFE